MNFMYRSSNHVPFLVELMDNDDIIKLALYNSLDTNISISGFHLFLPEDTSNDLQFLLFSEHVQNEVIRHPGLNATELT